MSEQKFCSLHLIPLGPSNWCAKCEKEAGFVAELQKVYAEHYPLEADIRMEIGAEEPSLADRAEEIANSQRI